MGIASQAPKTWKKPPEGTVKLNSDACLFGFESALDVLARDDSWLMLMSWTMKVPFGDPAMAKLLL